MNVEFNIILQNTEKLMACLVTFFVFRFHFLLLDIERKYMGEGEMKKGGGRKNRKLRKTNFRDNSFRLTIEQNDFI